LILLELCSGGNSSNCHNSNHCQIFDVRLTVTHQYCVETAKCIIRPFSPSGSDTILVFPHQTLWQYSNGDPLTNAGVIRNLDFLTLFLRNSTRYGHAEYFRNGKPTRYSYNEILIVTYTHCTQRCHF